MHNQAMCFLIKVRQGLSVKDKTILEVGSRDVNGSIRQMFYGCTLYTGMDHVAGKGVDVVADLYQWEPPIQYDIVICTEVLEHVVDPRKAMHRMFSWVAPSGMLVMTCATLGRKPHTATGHTLVEGQEPYQNVTPDMLELYGDYDIEINAQHKDLYVVWRKPLI